MRRTLRITSLVMVACFLTLAVQQPATAQLNTDADTDREGTAGSAWLLVSPTARTASLGSGLTGAMSSMNALEAAFTNPAGLTLNQGTSALFSRTQYPVDISLNYFGVSQNFGPNNVALIINAWDFGEEEILTSQNPNIGENTPTWSATFLTAGLGYARQFTDRIDAGIVAKLVSESIANDMNASTIAFDAGINYTVGETGVRFGVSLKNYGPSLEYGGQGLRGSATFGDEQQEVGENADERGAEIPADDFELPSLLNFGISYTRDIGAAASATLLGNFRSNAYSEDQFSGGLELGVQDIFFVRGGYQYEQDLADRSFYQGWNVGAGLNLDLGERNLAIDYAYRPTDYFDNVQMFTASVEL